MSIDLVQMGWIGIAVAVASFLIGLLILWLIIYSAVKAALGAHQSDVDAAVALRADRAARVAARDQREDWR